MYHYDGRLNVNSSRNVIQTDSPEVRQDSDLRHSDTRSEQRYPFNIVGTVHARGAQLVTGGASVASVCGPRGQSTPLSRPARDYSHRWNKLESLLQESTQGSNAVTTDSVEKHASSGLESCRFSDHKGDQFYPLSYGMSDPGKPTEGVDVIDNTLEGTEVFGCSAGYDDDDTGLVTVELRHDRIGACKDDSDLLAEMLVDFDRQLYEHGKHRAFLLEGDDDDDDVDFDNVAFQLHEHGMDRAFLDHCLEDDDDSEDADFDNNDVDPTKYAVIKECLICFELRPVRCMPCCLGVFCEDCLRLHCTSQVQQAQVRIQCPTPACRHIIPDSVILQLLADEHQARFLKFQIDSAKDPYQKTCPQCGSAYNVERGDLKRHGAKRRGLNVTCQECGFAWCFQCQAPWHSGMSCKTYKKGDRAMRAWAQKRTEGTANAQPCPKCKTYIQKSEGCNHMTCNQCLTEFCFECGSRYRRHMLLGDHHGRYNVLGCKFRYAPNNAVKRRFVRGSLLGIKITLLLPILVVAAPFWAFYKLQKRIRRFVRQRQDNEDTFGNQMFLALLEEIEQMEQMEEMTRRREENERHEDNPIAVSSAASEASSILPSRLREEAAVGMWSGSLDDTASSHSWPGLRAAHAQCAKNSWNGIRQIRELVQNPNT